MFRRVLFPFLLVISFNLNAQLATNQRIKKITSSTTPIVLDSLSIIPNTFFVTDEYNIQLDTTWYRIDYVKASFVWKGEPEKIIKIKYHVFPIALAQPYQHKDNKLIKELPIDNSSYYVYKPLNAQQTLFNMKGLEKNGSISRGIMFGNNQNLSVNSNMNLQMTGKISNDIEILAAISDDNLPFQPEGNTQQINEFDKVFVQLKKDSTVLTAGDYELIRPDSYFMNFYKRTQGGMISHLFKTKNNWTFKTKVAIAVAKGRSARQEFNGQESNQGPYRLSGNNSETYIVILAGTERVFIDGIALLRGQDNDYVIDYNTAEITFTTKQLITQKSRISIEFEYSDKNYSRSLSYFNQQLKSDKLAFRLNYYNEKDNKNQAFLQELSDSQKQFMEGLGNQVSNAYFPNIQEVAFNENEILYEKKQDNNGQNYYQYSTDPLNAKYRVGFSYVGQGKGNYQLNNRTAANGKVYEYIEPQGSNKQGNYEPITLLITPKQQELITFGIDFSPQKQSFFSSEFALSNNNVNLFANKNLANTRGYGLKLHFNQIFPLNKQGLKLNTKGDYEFVNHDFKALERYRDVEFNRDFNLDNTILTATNEHLVKSNIEIYQTDYKQLNYGLQTLFRTGNYQGFLQKIGGKYEIGTYQFQYDGSLLNSNSLLDKGFFYKHFIDIHKALTSKLTGGVSFEKQQNNTSMKTMDSLNTNSFSYELYKVYFQSKNTEKNRYRLDFNIRNDKLPRANQLISSSVNKGVNFSMDLTQNQNSKLSLTTGYRKTAYKNNFVNQQEDESLLGRLDYQLKTFKGFIQSNLFYEVGNGQEPRREITYLEVLPGQGVYAWNDYNNNGIKELDEFEIARFPDQAKFIRIYTAGTQYIRTNFTGINQSININPAAIINKSNRSFFKKLTYQLTYKIDRKILAAKGWDNYNPFDIHIDGTNLISLNALMRNSLFFNRNNPKFGIDINVLNDGGKSFLSNGFDSRKRNEMGLRLRASPFIKTYLAINWTNGQKSFQSELFTQRNYQIDYLEIGPEINYQFNTNFRWGIIMTLGNQHNLNTYGGEKNKNFNFSSDVRFNIPSKGVITARVSFINNNFIGNINNSVAYEMLAGLQTGDNYTWNFGLQRNISNGIQLNINYEGRKSPMANTVHTGNMQVRAYF